MIEEINGKVYVLGDNVDTDQIIPAEYLVYSLSDEKEAQNYGKFALSGVPPEKAGLPEGNIAFVESDMSRSNFSIVLAGSNFGCGSSREHAPFALQKAGVKAVIAESYARIFYRNAVDGGFLIPLESEGKLNEVIKTGDEVTIDLVSFKIKNNSNGKIYRLKPLGAALPIVEADGLFGYARKNELF